MGKKKTPLIVESLVIGDSITSLFSSRSHMNLPLNTISIPTYDDIMLIKILRSKTLCIEWHHFITQTRVTHRCKVEVNLASIHSAELIGTVLTIKLNGIGQMEAKRGYQAWDSKKDQRSSTEWFDNSNLEPHKKLQQDLTDSLDTALEIVVHMKGQEVKARKELTMLFEQKNEKPPSTGSRKVKTKKRKKPSVSSSSSASLLLSSSSSSSLSSSYLPVPSVVVPSLPTTSSSTTSLSFLSSHSTASTLSSASSSARREFPATVHSSSSSSSSSSSASTSSSSTDTAPPPTKKLKTQPAQPAQPFPEIKSVSLDEKFKEFHDLYANFNDSMLKT